MRWIDNMVVYQCIPAPEDCVCGERTRLAGDVYRCPPLRCCQNGGGAYVVDGRFKCKPNCYCGASFEHHGKYICPLCECEKTCVNGFTLKRECCGSCFPSSTRVTLENGQSETMSELHIGDKVQTGIRGALCNNYKLH